MTENIEPIELPPLPTHDVIIRLAAWAGAELGRGCDPRTIWCELVRSTAMSGGLNRAAAVTVLLQRSDPWGAARLIAARG